jgi:cytochrome c oxidase subunit 2
MGHGRRIALIWVVASIIVEILIAIVPLPIPTGSTEAMGARQTMYMLFYVAAPIFVFVWVLFAYDLLVFRAKPGDTDEERPAPPDSTPILLLWAGISFVIVLFLAGWGTFTLHEITSPPPPAVAAVPSGTHGKPYQGLVEKPGHPLVIQVIGQEWFWTFRYPSYGGMETRQLEIPDNTLIQLHITSLDVVHSFWSYEYDIKEDAVPGVDNTAWFQPTKPGSFSLNGQNWVKCNELCGIWHGYMRNPLYVVPASTFVSWAKHQEAYERSTGVLKNLPKFSYTYYPAANSNWPPAPQDQSP